MSVKCLTTEEKRQVIAQYNASVANNMIAAYFGVSERTIGRVLVEYGLAQPVQRLKEEANTVMKVLKKYNVSPYELEPILRNRAQTLEWQQQTSRPVRPVAALLAPKKAVNEVPIPRTSYGH